MKKFSFGGNKANLILIIGIFVVVTIVYLIKGGTENNPGTFTFGEDSLTVYGPESYQFIMKFDDIKDASLIEDFDEGTPVSGETQSSYSYGKWTCTTYGEYNLCKLTKVNTVIAVTLNDGTVYVFNFESDTTTNSFYEQFIEYVK